MADELKITKKHERNSNLELFRIIVMLLIIAHHYVVNSGLTSANGPMEVYLTSGKSIFLWLFGAWGKTGINCFVMITGYFMCKSTITSNKFFKLFFEVYFYDIVIYAVFLFTGYTEFNLKSFLNILLPITNIGTNFTSCFLVFYLCIPFLTILVNNMNEKQHICFLTILGFTYTFLSSVRIKVTMNYLSWFMVLFLISSYIRIYPKKLFESKAFWGTASLISLILSVLSMFVCINLVGYPYEFLFDCNKILAVTNGITWFMFFKNIKIKQSKVINALGGSTFGVLLIHANCDAMRQWLWRDLLNNVGMYESDFIYLHAILSVISIFIICALIDILRQKTIEKIFLKEWNKLWKQITVRFKTGIVSKFRTVQKISDKNIQY